MTLLYDDGRQGEINLIASQDSIIHLGDIDFENTSQNDTFCDGFVSYFSLGSRDRFRFIFCCW